eukprot:gene21887-biopygen14725
MSGVGAPATRPRPVARARRGARNRATASPRREARNGHRPYVWGWGPSCTTPKLWGGPRARLYVWGWGPSCTAPPCSAGA